MLLSYLPILTFILLAVLFAAVSLLLSSWVGPRRPDPAKLAPYECGITPVGAAQQQVSVKFYLVAVLFIIFDIEIAFLYPWAVVFRHLKVFGLIEMVVFLVVLLLGFAYAWKKGGLEWD